MDLGTRFPLHVHPGDHILFVLSGRGGVVINQEFHPVGPNDSIFIAAEYPHGVCGPKRPEDAPLRFLAVGVPHMNVESKDRMKLVEETVEDRNAYGLD
jgi:mannose-6-phosphate isomerase-like protein (cupin superfamily)